MALTERLQLIIESLGGAAAAADLGRIGDAGEKGYGRAAKSADDYAAAVKHSQDKVAEASASGATAIQRANEKVESAQLKAAQSSAAVERAQQKVAATAPGTLQAARASESLEQAQLKAEHAASALERAQAGFQATSAKTNATVTEAKKELAGAEAAAQRFGQASAAAGEEVQKLGVDAHETSNLLELGIAATATAAGAALIKFTKDGIDSFLELTSQVRTYQRVSGALPEDASKIVAAARSLKVEIDTVSTGVLKLSQIVEQTPEKLHDLGIEIAYARDGSVDLTGTLRNVADAYANAHTQTEKNTIAVGAFGKGARDLIPLLAQGKEGLDKLAEAALQRGDILSDEDLKKAADYKQALLELHQTIGGIGREIGSSALPYVTGFTRALETAVETGGKPFAIIAAGSIAGVAGIARITEAVVSMREAVETGALGMGKLVGAAKVLAGIGIIVGVAGAVTAAVDQITRGTEKLNRAQRELSTADARQQMEALVQVATRTGKSFNEIVEDTARENLSAGRRLAEGLVAAGEGSATQYKAIIDKVAEANRQGALDQRANTDEVEASTAAEDAAADALKKHLEVVTELSSAGVAAYRLMGGVTDDLAVSESGLAESFDVARTAASKLKQGLDILIGVHVDARQANIAYEQAVDDLTESLITNGTNLDDSEEAGRKNNAAIVDMITSTIALADAQTREGASSDAVTAAYLGHVAQLREVLAAAGFTTEQIDALVSSYNLLAAAPDIKKRVDVVTNFTETGTSRTVGAFQARGYGASTGGEMTSLGPVLHMANAGPIPGSGSGDHVPILAEPGEYMFDKRSVQNAGGIRTMAALHRGLKRMASGGPVGGLSGGVGGLGDTIYVTVNVYAPLMSTEAQLASKVDEVLARRRASNGGRLVSDAA